MYFLDYSDKNLINNLHKLLISGEKIDKILNNSMIALYHGCRPLSIDDYEKNGILISTYERRKEYAQKICLALNLDKPTTYSILNRIKNNKHTPTYNNLSHLQVNKNMFFEGAGHYVIYGSEAIYSAFNCEGIGSLLKTVGVPTIIKIQLPFQEIGSGAQKAVTSSIKKLLRLSSIYQKIYRPRCDITAFIEKDIPKENIITFETVEKIKDPFKQLKEYVYEYAR